MAIPKHSEYQKDYKRLKKLVGRFIKADDEIRYADAKADIGASMDDHQQAGDEILHCILYLMKVSA